jgi:hypothetical protein
MYTYSDANGLGAFSTASKTAAEIAAGDVIIAETGDLGWFGHVIAVANNGLGDYYYLLSDGHQFNAATGDSFTVLSS